MSAHGNLSARIIKYLKAVPGCRVDNRQGKGNDAGLADLYCCYNGQHYEIEIKVLPDKLSDIQRIQKTGWEDAGAVFITAYDIDDVRRIIR